MPRNVGHHCLGVRWSNDDVPLGVLLRIKR